MEIKGALKGQYHAAFAMMRECIEKCPDEVWVGGKHPRNPWRIAYHAVFYTHWYLLQHMDDLEPWAKHRPSSRVLWDDDEDPTPVESPYSRAEVLEYLDSVDARVDGWVDALDLEAGESGFSWYSMPKFEHQLVNIRHLAGHVGQLSELVFETGADLDWVNSGSGRSG